jgi:polyribonucleotide 5'-hydroxyl-kinase
MTRRFQKPASSTATPTTPPITVLKLDKSGGCVDRDAAYQIALRDAQVRAYFFGTARHALSPHTQLIEYADVRIFTTPERRFYFLSETPVITDI